MTPFALLIKPASADCNLVCEYCFYLDKRALYPEKVRRRMSMEVLERIISSYMRTRQPAYQFGWQGGEPALMGGEFFRRAVEFQRQYAPPGSRISNGFQTNATLIDENTAAVLSDYRFLAGVSLDGPARIHDTYRRFPGGRGSHSAVMKGIEMLRRHQIEFNILTLVNSANQGSGKEVYRYLRDSGFRYHQYIPCVEFNSAGDKQPYAVGSCEWGGFLCEVFDEWIKKDVRTVSVRLFDSILDLLVNGRRNTCDMSETCCQYFMVEYNGDVYPCDFFAEPGMKLGNIMESDWMEIARSSRYMEFGANKARVNKKCASCAWLHYCMGDCLKHRFRKSKCPCAISYLCPGWEKFYGHAISAFHDLAAGVKKDTAGGPGRNSPCPCGSGLKYKRCHGSRA